MSNGALASRDEYDSPALEERREMAGAFIGEAFLTASIQTLCDKIGSGELLDLFRGKKLDYSLMEKLKVTLTTLHAVLNDAEEKQIVNPYVRKWLHDLKHAVFDAEDLLDEIDTESLRCKVEAEFQTKRAQVWNFLPISVTSFYQDMNGRVEDLFQRLEHLAKHKDLLGLREGVGGKVSHRTPTTSFVEHKFCTYGREGDKEKLETLLLSDDATGKDISVIPIVGMGGVGKTTLAQLLYNDEKVKDHFDVQAWVYVSEDYDAVRITKTLLESITSKPCLILDMSFLQVQLREQLNGKKNLIVLDDLWNDNYSDWDLLRAPFTFGARGSKVIVTTRNRSVASIMHTVPIHYLEQLSHEDCWLLLANHVFRNGNPSAHPELEQIGKKIARKCNGLPLAAKALGGLLRSSIDHKEWNHILNSHIWELLHETSILPALRLSYHYLPTHLKRCFAYCSIFPKDFKFRKENLILLWIAEGLVPQAENAKRMEEISEKYFDELLSRSLFQRSRVEESSFTMHDLVNDLAMFVSGELCFRLDGGESDEVPKRVRHLSYIKGNFYPPSKFDPLYGVKSLRTFLPLISDNQNYISKRVSHDLLPMLSCLRVLSLSEYTNVTELPNSIGNLIHLRYLDLSYTAIKRLPDIVCTLCNLQTLIMSYCSSLTELPTDMRKLINLRHLDIRGTKIEEMPLQMGRLKSLRTLTAFVVGKSSGSSIRELREFGNLRGELSILKLQNVVDIADALHVSLKDTEDLREIVLAWGPDTIDPQKERDVLERLQPPIDLQKLTITFYGGTSFPNWLGDSSFSNIQFLCLNNCSYCLSLPPLGQLPGLKELSIARMKFLTKIGPEFYGNGSSLIQPFQSLEKLEYEEMPEWEEWLPSRGQCSDFPCLQRLVLVNCPKLRGDLPNQLPSLRSLRVSRCAVLHERATALNMEVLDMECLQQSLEQLQINGCTGLLSLLETEFISLQKLAVGNFVDIQCLPKQMVHHSNCLQHLSLFNCPSLLSFPTDGLPTTLVSLSIHKCRRLEFLPHEMMAKLTSLEHLDIYHSCDSIRSFSLGSFPKLNLLEIKNCVNLESLSIEEVDDNLSHLNYLQISKCPNLVSFPHKGLCTPNLDFFSVWGCKNLKSLPERIHTLTALRGLTLSNLPSLESFAEGGLPPNLKRFYVGDCDRLGTSVEWGLQGLSSLIKFSIGGRGSKDLLDALLNVQLLPTSLHTLKIFGLSSLKSLDGKGLQHLTSLKRLVIYDCPSLNFLQEEGLPASLSLLKIKGCSSLKKRCHNKTGEDWAKIAHIPCIQIDEEVII